MQITHLIASVRSIKNNTDVFHGTDIGTKFICTGELHAARCDVQLQVLGRGGT